MEIALPSYQLTPSQNSSLGEFYTTILLVNFPCVQVILGLIKFLSS